MSNLHHLNLAERIRRGERSKQPTYSAVAGGTTIWTDAPPKLGLIARIKRWWRGAR